MSASSFSASIGMEEEILRELRQIQSIGQKQWSLKMDEAKRIKRHSQNWKLKGTNFKLVKNHEK